MTKIKDIWAFAAIAVTMFVCVIVFRPLLPIDETRYMSVAWELWQKGDWLAPLTKNYEPYHHKPPLLFWLINSFWALFGVSRWAGTIPIFLLSFANLYLTQKIFQKTFSDLSSDKVAWVFLGSLPFMFYSTLVMFDFGMCFLILLSLLCLIRFLETTKWVWMIVLGLFLGLAVLMKGPVAYLYILFPALLAPLWSEKEVNKMNYYFAFVGAILVSTVPVLLWLIPILLQSDNNFAFWLVWNQTAGRITGGFDDAHVRPFYFYMMFVPLLFVPWIFFPSFWGNIKKVKKTKAMILVFSMSVPAFIAFSIISGKQFHYLVPLMPAVILFMSFLLRDVTKAKIVKTSLLMVVVFLVAHFVASKAILKNYDLEPLAKEVAMHQDKNIAFVRNYHAELGFLGRLTKPIDDISRENIDSWFEANPKGSIAVIRYADPAEVKGFHQIADYPYRSKRIGMFEKK